METATKLMGIFESSAKKFVKMSESIEKETNSYEFEQTIRSGIGSLGHILYQGMIGESIVSKDERLRQMTSFGEIVMNKHHPLAVSPGGFKISAYLQGQMCRLGTKMTFEESGEELNKLLGLDVNAKHIERLCHHYGGQLASINWREVYWDGVQLRLPLDKQLYLLMDGSMLLTREKGQSWKEVKLCRMSFNDERVEGISKNRNQLSPSRYVAHLGNHEGFLDKVLEVIQAGYPPVFIADGAKWIWNWIDDDYPDSTQILDFYHCKGHLCLFAKEYFAKEEMPVWVEGCIEKLKPGQVETLLGEIAQLPNKNKHLKKEKNKLLAYLANNKKRINYGKFIKDGLLIGSGAIESANRCDSKENETIRTTLDDPRG